ncbi:serine/threonine protein kinase [Desmospora profundinema]|uniref:Serine/threonine protein kinase n=1 Tax=Desmospora profundinema TaxID=1571184 RepID=A0ABU1IRJ0_9BACL|nr:serine/threonine protein kinase [Desmospora profundinema]MDR6227412.1 hypothetical protein [Desmospora profundinema]
MSWEQITSLVNRIDLESSPGNHPVVPRMVPEPLEIVGVGTDAAVVRHPDRWDTVFKVYAPGREQAWADEQKVYKRLGESPWFPVMKGGGPGFLVLSHEKGPTLYDCLTEGIPIPSGVVDEVEEARRFVREKGLNPRDIHLKNVLLQNGHAKLVDVSEYLKPGEDGRWDYLVQAYHRFYPLIRGKRIPEDVLEGIKQTYRECGNHPLSMVEWKRRFFTLLSQTDHSSP